LNGIAWLAALLALSAAPLALAVPYLARRRPGFGLWRFVLAAIAGFVAVVPAALVQAAVPRNGQSAAGLLIHAFGVIAFTEEGSKYLLLRFSRRRWGGEENAIPAGIAASLGFAFFETIVYASSNPSAILIRAVTAAPLAAACGSWVGRAALAPRTRGPFALFYLMFAILVHGAYDLTLLVPGFPVFVPVLIALFGLATALRSLSMPVDGEN
jgi:RsiW-degrading membrane proteinase PrsW (M82 family)